MKSALALTLLVAGCGDDGNTLLDAATADGKSADAAADSAPLNKEGQVFLAKIRTPNQASIAAAMLYDAPLEMPTATADGCITRHNTPASSIAAGSITVTGTTTGLTLSQQNPGDVYVPATPAPADLFSAGATLTVTATGATVPAFSGTVTGPAMFSNVVFPTTLSRSAAASITWTAGSGTTMWFLVNTEAGAMFCRGPDNGTFTLTTAALALLPASATSASIIGYRVNETTTTAGAWTIYIRAADGQSSGAISVGP